MLISMVVNLEVHFRRLLLRVKMQFPGCYSKKELMSTPKAAYTEAHSRQLLILATRWVFNCSFLHEQLNHHLVASTHSCLKRTCASYAYIVVVTESVDQQ